MLKIDMHSHIIPKHLPNWTEKFGYGDFINDLSTAKEIVEVFFKQVAENPQLTYEKAE